MGLWDKLRGELIDIVEWLDPSNDTMVHRFQRHGNEIKYGAQLVVREGQAAVFVNEGKAADIFPPGTYRLETRNLPILATLKGWKYGFESPFKAEVYFCSTRRFTDLKWGTRNPIMLRDPEFGPLRLRAYGTYTIRISDPAVFIREIVGTDGHFTTDEVSEQLRNEIVSHCAVILGESEIPALELAANYDDLGRFMTVKMRESFAEYGLQVDRLLVENISLPPEVEEALDKRSQMGVIGDLAAYTQFQTAEALRDAAQQPGGLAGGGLGLGAGFAMAQKMTESMTMGAAAASQPSSSQPPPLPASDQWFAALGGQQTGPFNPDELTQHIRDGKVTRQTLVWKKGLDGWARAGELDDLEAAFGDVPPPLPSG